MSDDVHFLVSKMKHLSLILIFCYADLLIADCVKDGLDLLGILDRHRHRVGGDQAVQLGSGSPLI